MDTRPLASLPKLQGIMSDVDRQTPENIARSLMSSQVLTNILAASKDDSLDVFIKLLSDKTLTEDQIRVLTIVRAYVRGITALKITNDWLFSLPKEYKVEDIVSKLDIDLINLANKEVEEFKKFMIEATQQKSTDKEVIRVWFWNNINDEIQSNIEPLLREDIAHQKDERVEQFHIMLRSRLETDIMYKFIADKVFPTIEDGANLEDVLANLVAIFNSDVFKKHVDEINQGHDKLYNYISGV